MEFLLKSQKRNRKRLIIEQFILLALRCLLVILAGFLVARFIGKATKWFSGENQTLHNVVIDDTLSMGDRWRHEGEERKAFDIAKDRVKQLAKDALTASSPQRLKLVTLSNLDNVVFNDRLNDQSLSELNKKLDELKPSMVHVKPIEAVKWAIGQVGGAQEQQRFLHLVSDLRDSDWSGSGSGQSQQGDR